MLNSLKTMHTSASFEDAKRAVEMLLEMKEWKYSFKKLSEDFVVYKGRGFIIKVLRRYYGAQVNIRGRFSEDISAELRILLPEKQLFRDTKTPDQHSLVEKTTKREIGSSRPEARHYVKLVANVINLVGFLLFLITGIFRKSSAGILFAILMGIYIISQILASIRHYNKK